MQTRSWVGRLCTGAGIRLSLEVQTARVACLLNRAQVSSSCPSHCTRTRTTSPPPPTPAPQAFGGPNDYKGRSMYEAHKGMGLTDAHFDAVAGHFVSTLKELGVAQPVIDEAAAVVLSTRPQVRRCAGSGAGARRAHAFGWGWVSCWHAAERGGQRCTHRPGDSAGLPLPTMRQPTISLRLACPLPLRSWARRRLEILALLLVTGRPPAHRPHWAVLGWAKKRCALSQGPGLGPFSPAVVFNSVITAAFGFLCCT